MLPHVSLSKAFQRGEPDSLLWQLANLATDPQDVEDSRMRVLSIFDEAGCGPDFLQYLEEHFETRIYLQGSCIAPLLFFDILYRSSSRAACDIYGLYYITYGPYGVSYDYLVATISRHLQLTSNVF